MRNNILTKCYHNKNNTIKMLNNKNNIDKLFTESVIESIVPNGFLENNKEFSVEWDFDVLNEELKKKYQIL